VALWILNVAAAPLFYASIGDDMELARLQASQFTLFASTVALLAMAEDILFSTICALVITKELLLPPRSLFAATARGLGRVFLVGVGVGFVSLAGLLVGYGLSDIAESPAAQAALMNLLPMVPVLAFELYLISRFWRTAVRLMEHWLAGER
jgi:hypothetical protein